MERPAALPVALLYIGAALEQGGHGLLLALHRGVDEGGPAVLVRLVHLEERTGKLGPEQIGQIALKSSAFEGSLWI